jgi:6-phosphogluconolactonase
MNRRQHPLLGAQIQLFPDIEAASAEAAHLVASSLRDGLSARAFASLAVCGGRTPGRALQLLAAQDVDWRSVAVTLTDERWVPRDHPLSNEGLLRTSLLVGRARAARLASMWSPTPDPNDGMLVYEALLEVMPDRFDVVLLGMGEDGHIASLFPRSGALVSGLDPDARTRCVAVPAGAAGADPQMPRLSLTLSEMVRAERVVLLTSGPAKLQVLQRALAHLGDPADLPIAALLAQRPDTVVVHAR